MEQSSNNSEVFDRESFTRTLDKCLVLHGKVVERLSNLQALCRDTDYGFVIQRELKERMTMIKNERDTLAVNEDHDLSELDKTLTTIENIFSRVVGYMHAMPDTVTASDHMDSTDQNTTLACQHIQEDIDTIIQSSAERDTLARALRESTCTPSDVQAALAVYRLVKLEYPASKSSEDTRLMAVQSGELEYLHYLKMIMEQRLVSLIQNTQPTMHPLFAKRIADIALDS